MELYIRIKDGQPFEHPILGDNFRKAFPDVDTNNLPLEFAKFTRVSCPEDAGVYQIYDGSYAWSGDLVQDVWILREMTSEEREEKTQLLLTNARNTVDILKTKAQKIMEITDEIATQAVLNFCTTLDAWLATDPINTPVPTPPRIKPDGTLMNVTVSGSEPNVIG
jgi:hypothetical protein